MSLLDRPLARRAALLALDLVLLAVAWFAAYTARFEFSIPTYPEDDYLTQMLMLAPWVLLTHGALLWAFRLYQGSTRYAGLRELGAIALATFVHTVVWVLINTVIETQEGLMGLPIVEPMPGEFHVMRIPYGVQATYAMAAVLLVGGLRFSRRLLSEGRPSYDDDAPRTLVVGAGDVAEAALRDLTRSRRPAFRPVAAVAVDPRKTGSSIRGLPIRGGLDAVATLLREEDIRAVLIALDEDDPARLRELVRACKEARAEFHIIPTMESITSGRVAVSPVRRVKLEDLLGREPVDLVLPEERNSVKDARVLVTGAGGSIGRELCRQIALAGPAELILLGRGEYSIYEAVGDLRAEHPDLAIKSVIANVTDENRMAAVFGRCRPEIVFHVAAHKHVPMMESCPAEAIRNNVVGTAITAFVAAQSGARQFVLISTDKAVRPTSVMGATKRLAEQIVFSLAGETETAFCAVRFGNVLGSRGSVVELFERQIAAGGPVTVTHPDVTRYFMTAAEAVSLTLQAASRRENGKLYLLDMGEPVRIADLARTMVTLSGAADVEIKYTGLQPGEKLREELLTRAEGAVATDIGKVWQTDGKAHPWEETAEVLRQLRALAERDASQRLVELMRDILGDYHPAGMEELSDEDALSEARAQAEEALEQSFEAARMALQAFAVGDQGDLFDEAPSAPAAPPVAVEPPTPEPVAPEPPTPQPVEEEQTESPDEEDHLVDDVRGAIRDAFDSRDEMDLPEETTPPPQPSTPVADEQKPVLPIHESDTDVLIGQSELDEPLPESEVLPPPDFGDAPETPLPEASAEPEAAQEQVEMEPMVDSEMLVRPPMNTEEMLVPGEFAAAEPEEAPEKPAEAPATDQKEPESSKAAPLDLFESQESPVSPDTEEMLTDPTFEPAREAPGPGEGFVAAYLGDDGGTLAASLDSLAAAAPGAMVVFAKDKDPESIPQALRMANPTADHPAALLNEALKDAPGDGYLVVASPSVTFPADFGERIDKAAEENPEAVLFYGDHTVVTPDGEERDVVLQDHAGCPHERFEFGPVIVYRAGPLLQAGGFREDLDHAWEYAAHLALMQEGLFVRLTPALYKVAGAAGEDGESALHSPGRGPLGGFSYAFYPPEIEKEVTEAFEDALKQVGAWLPPDGPFEQPPPDTSDGVSASVVTPVLNRADTIGAAIDSVLDGSYQDFEIVVVDNGSTDGTREMVRERAEKDARVRLIDGTGKNIASALNDGVRAARGWAICQLDSDDLYTPETLARMMGHLESEPLCALAISYYRLADASGKPMEDVAIVTHKGHDRNQILRRDGAGALRVFRKSVLLKLGLFEQEHYGHFGEDYDMVLKVSERYRIDRVPEVLYLYRRHAGNTDVTRSEELKYKNKNRARQQALIRRMELNAASR